jgi:hypothetical protein
VVTRRDESQPPQNEGDGDDVDDGPSKLSQLLRSTLDCHPLPGWGGFLLIKMFTCSSVYVCIMVKNEKIEQ